MNKAPHKFTVTVPVKPYVKQFLNINYGLPLDFCTDPRTNEFFLKLLKKSNFSRDNMYPEFIIAYSQEVEIFISEHDFYRFGWELSKTDTVAFGKYFENRAKIFMRTMVGIYTAIGLPAKNSITKFQGRFYFDEDIWAYESIKKDFYRHGFNESIDFEGEIFKKIEKIVLRNLYDLGTISNKTICKHETDK
jgi:hypothetical protein